MTDEEYRDYLVSLASKHLSTSRLYDYKPGRFPERLTYDLERLSSANRLLRAVRDRSENQVLLTELAQALRNNTQSVVDIIDAMETAGMLAALDEAPEITFGNLRRSAIPDEDIQLLARAGVDEPEAEINILIHSGPKVFVVKQPPSEVVRQAPDELKRAADRIEQMNQPGDNQPPKKRKLFNGIGKLLAGTITGAGNLLLAMGTVAAPNPATAYLAMGSSAIAALYIGQGVGDLRGE